MHPVVESLARVLMRQRGFATFTALVEQLIRDDWDKRATVQMEAELMALVVESEKVKPPSPSPASAAPVDVVKNTRSKGKFHTPKKKFGKG